MYLWEVEFSQQSFLRSPSRAGKTKVASVTTDVTTIIELARTKLGNEIAKDTFCSGFRFLDEIAVEGERAEPVHSKVS
jgi:hypothetical protein